MSNALAISGVTAVLQYFLNNVYINSPLAALGTVKVSAVAPDVVQSSFGNGSSSQLQVNVFLHQVTPNAAWRNVGLASVAADGSSPLKNPPLALDLHYLLTAYAGADTEAEALLGYAVLMLHENPVLPRNQIRAALTNLSTAFPDNQLFVPSPSTGLSPLQTSGLADQIEMIKITPATLGREEMAWLWTALKADYRPTFPFQVSVVLVQNQLPSTSPLPVLSRSISAQAEPATQFGSEFAQLLGIQLPPGQNAAASGDTVTVTGTGLATATQVALANQRLGVQYGPIAPGPVTSGSISFTVPDDAANLPAGVYSLSVVFTNASGAAQSTNNLPFGVAPKLSNLASSPNASGTWVTLSCDPDVIQNQTVSLALGAMSAPAQPFTAPASALTFQFPALAAGQYLARLRVDGVESPVTVNWSANPPVFTAPFLTV
jgi:hypothetical protein